MQPTPQSGAADAKTLGVIAVKFDVYGRFQLEVVREDGRWVAYRLDIGKRMKWNELAIPSSLEAEEIAQYLDDLHHEMAKPGQTVREFS